MLLQSGTDVLNEVDDVRTGVVHLDGLRGPVMLGGRMAPWTARRLGLASVAAGVAAGALISWLVRRRPSPFVLGLGGAVIGYAYSAA